MITKSKKKWIKLFEIFIDKKPGKCEFIVFGWKIFMGSF